VTGYPLRKSLVRTNPPAARAHFGLRDDLPVVMVMGGSQGAHTINQVIFRHLSNLLDDCQMIHITGTTDSEAAEHARQSLPADKQERYLHFGYLHEEMGIALSCAQLVISRAGASTLGEYPAYELPAVLVPYPFAWRYQTMNAEYLAARGAAILMPDAEMDAQMVAIVHDLLQDPNRLASMSIAMHALSRPDAAGRIADLVRKLAEGHPLPAEEQA
jgi:UDP-N-acetylglucosamine--N-acetylmuramyl-(pentapeptide) pyrophosphoryl-undecaprenol N-acetylglucosamine transferase